MNPQQIRGIDATKNGIRRSLLKMRSALLGGRQLPSGLEDRLEAALLTSLDFRAGWTTPLQQNISLILSQL
jgi:hypothetical protein